MPTPYCQPIGIHGTGIFTYIYTFIIYHINQPFMDRNIYRSSHGSRAGNVQEFQHSFHRVNLRHSRDRSGGSTAVGKNYKQTHMGVSKNRGTQNGWLILETY